MLISESEIGLCLRLTISLSRTQVEGNTLYPRFSFLSIYGLPIVPTMCVRLSDYFGISSFDSVVRLD